MGHVDVSGLGIPRARSFKFSIYSLFELREESEDNQRLESSVATEFFWESCRCDRDGNARVLLP